MNLHAAAPVRYEPLSTRIERQQRAAVADLHRARIIAHRAKAIRLAAERSAAAAEREAQERADLAGLRPIALAVALTSRRLGVSEIDIQSARRTKRIALARHVAMYVARTLTTASYPEIGRRIGRRDHTTVIHGVRRIGALVAAGDPIAEDVRRVIAEYQTLRRSA